MPGKRSGKARFLCSELVTVRWVSEFGSSREVTANLEEIWESGAQLQLPNPIRTNIPVHVSVEKTELFSGVVQSCAADFVGYFVDIEFEGGYRWSPAQFEPEHLFDPRSLLKRDNLEEKNQKMLAECNKVLSSGVV